MWSRPAGGVVRTPRPVERGDYYARHPGLHTELTDGIESEIVPRTCARK